MSKTTTTLLSADHQKSVDGFRRKVVPTSQNYNSPNSKSPQLYVWSPYQDFLPPINSTIFGWLKAKTKGGVLLLIKKQIVLKFKLSKRGMAYLIHGKIEEVP